MKLNRLIRIGLLAFAGLAHAGTCLAVEEEGKAKKANTENEKAKAPEKSSKPAEKKTKVVAIVGADIITVTRETIRGGTLLVEDGKIKAMGTAVEVPEGAEVIDASGKYLAPGFVALSISRVGFNESQDSSANHVDGLNPFDRNISLALGVGITSGCTNINRPSKDRGATNFAPEGEVFPYTERFPGFDPDAAEIAKLEPAEDRAFGKYVQVCKCCGLPILNTAPIEPTKPTPISTRNSLVLKMSYGSLKGMLIAENRILDVSAGSLTGALNQRNWREQFRLAREYLELQAKHERETASGKKTKPPRKPVSDDFLKLVKGEVALRVAADSQSDIREMLDLAKELDYKIAISGAAEAWTLADEFSEADASVIFAPRVRRRPVFGKEDQTGTWIEMPRVLEEAGVPFATTSLSNSISLGGLAGRDLTSLPLEAAFAVRGGASEREALASITIVPATILGLQDRIGSLEVGKDADILILNGQPLDYRTYVETAMVNGRVAYERAKARVLPVYEK